MTSPMGSQMRVPVDGDGSIPYDVVGQLGQSNWCSATSSTSSVPRRDLPARFDLFSNAPPGEFQQPLRPPRQLEEQAPPLFHERGGQRRPETWSQGQDNLPTPTDDSDQSVSREDRSELDTDRTTVPCLRPLELAEWLRTLPSGKLAEEARKAVARRVLDEDIDGLRFEQLLEEGSWESLGVADEREGHVLYRFFRTKQHETMQAEAARSSAAMNRSLIGTVQPAVQQAAERIIPSTIADGHFQERLPDPTLRPLRDDQSWTSPMPGIP